MNESHVLLAIMVAAVVTWLTDWFFGGVLLHERYHRYPEVWRRSAGGPGETRAIAWATVTGVLTCVAFVAACASFRIVGFAPALKLAGFIWLIGPLPHTISTALFIKMDPLLVAGHSIGWLVKLGATALAVGWIMP